MGAWTHMSRYRLAMGVFLSTSQRSFWDQDKVQLWYLNAGSRPKKVTKVINEMKKITAKAVFSDPMVPDFYRSPSLVKENV